LCAFDATVTTRSVTWGRSRGGGVTKPYHHGNLRAVLLEHAERLLVTAGANDLSLRELAREAGVSHGAPRRSVHPPR
jgi:AcrR family transcriptional regulator